MKLSLERDMILAELENIMDRENQGSRGRPATTTSMAVLLSSSSSSTSGPAVSGSGFSTNLKNSPPAQIKRQHNGQQQHVPNGNGNYGRPVYSPPSAAAGSGPEPTENDGDALWELDADHQSFLFSILQYEQAR